MKIKLNTEIIKTELIESLIRNNKLVSLLDRENKIKEVYDLINEKIFTYLRVPCGCSTSMDNFICIDVEESEAMFIVHIKIRNHEAISKNKDNYFFNRVDRIAERIKENVKEVFPKATRYICMPGYQSPYITKDISFKLHYEDECATLDDKKLYDKYINGQDLLNALRKYIREH